MASASRAASRRAWVIQRIEFRHRPGQLGLVVRVPVGVVRGIRNYQMLRVSSIVDIGKIFLHYGPSPSNKIFIARVEIIFVKGGYKVDRVRQGIVISVGHCVTRRQTGAQFWGQVAGNLTARSLVAAM